MSNISLASINTPASGLTLNGGGINLTPPQSISLTGSGDKTLTPAQINGGLVLVSTGVNSPQYSVNLPSAADMWTYSNQTPGKTYNFSIYASWSFNLTILSGGAIYGATYGDANGANINSVNRSAGGPSILIPNQAYYTVSVRVLSSSQFNAYIK